MLTLAVLGSEHILFLSVQDARDEKAAIHGYADVYPDDFKPLKLDPNAEASSYWEGSEWRKRT